MASIINLKNGWRAQICVSGIRESAMFSERYEAETWAKNRETELNLLKKTVNNLKRINKNKMLIAEVANGFSDIDIITNSFEIPSTSGIYFLISNDTIVYVGQSVNVLNRIRQHLADKFFDKINIIQCPEKELIKLESFYIKKFNPILNKVGKNTFSDANLIQEIITT